MTSNYQLVAKLALTAVTLIYGIVPAIADLNETHLLNSHWSAHARLHGAWFLFFGASMAALSRLSATKAGMSSRLEAGARTAFTATGGTGVSATPTSGASLRNVLDQHVQTASAPCADSTNAFLAGGEICPDRERLTFGQCIPKCIQFVSHF